MDWGPTDIATRARLLRPETTFVVPLNNTVTCHSCGVTICSVHRHDFQTCDCGAVSVDGGFDYVRRGAYEGASWEEWASAWERDDLAAAEIERVKAIAETRLLEQLLTPRQRMFRQGRMSL